MRVSEWMLAGFLVYLLVLALIRPLPPVRRWRALLACALLLVALPAAPRLEAWPAGQWLRDFLPLVYTLVYYWQTGAFFIGPQPAIEARFLQADRAARDWLGLADIGRTAPRALLEGLELAYLACYVTLPVGLAVSLWAGGRGAVDRFWSIVVLAELGCYAVLPWVRTRPPWALIADRAIDTRPLLLRRINMAVVRHGSTCLNTFPSGHAAGALATALAVAAVWPVAGLGFAVLAIGIAVASVVGDYHYAGDALAGAVVALAAWGLAALSGM